MLNLNHTAIQLCFKSLFSVLVVSPGGDVTPYVFSPCVDFSIHSTQSFKFANQTFLKYNPVVYMIQAL